MCKKRTIHNRIWAVVLAASLGLAAVGCDNAVTKGDENVPELVEPVGVAADYDIADYRTMFDAKIYNAVVCPEVTEYSYTDNQNFGTYGKMPGQEVVAGDILMYGTTDNIEKQVEEKEKAIAETEEAFEDEVLNMQEDIEDAKENEAYYQCLHDKAVFEQPDENDWNAMQWWKARVEMTDGPIEMAHLNVMKQIQALKEKTELHELDMANEDARLARLQNKIAKTELSADAPGVVVGMSYYDIGTFVEKGQAVAAVGDLQQKELKCEFISKSEVNRADEIFAVVNGKQYEVNYHSMDPEEYNRLMKKNNVVYTTFDLIDPNNEVAFGDYAALVVVTEKLENALCVPKDAVFRDDSGTYVYIVDGENNIYTNVKVGKSDGMYTEIENGLEPGAKVLSEQAPVKSSSTAKLVMGSTCNEFDTSGYLFYPSSEWIKNPNEHGTSYINEICVSEYEPVEEGQVLARIEVVTDQVEIQRREREILRSQVRLQTLQDKRGKLDPEKQEDEAAIKSLDRAIRTRSKSILKLSEELAEWKTYAGVFEIKAPKNGVITGITELEAGDLINTDENIVQISGSDNCYIIVEDEGGVLSYGNKVSVDFRDASNMPKTIDGEVVTVSPMAMSASMNMGYSLVSVAAEDMSSVIGSVMSSGGWWNRSRFTIKTNTRVMNNVLLVPKKAVTLVGGDTFVKVINDDGSVKYVSFVAGGSDITNYWCVSGLSEGMEICLE